MFSSLACVTTSGPDPNKQCKFPFDFDGTTYYECTSEGRDRPWCATEVDIDDGRKVIEDKWGNCGSVCSPGNFRISSLIIL